MTLDYDRRVFVGKASVDFVFTCKVPLKYCAEPTYSKSVCCCSFNVEGVVPRPVQSGNADTKKAEFHAIFT